MGLAIHRLEDGRAIMGSTTTDTALPPIFDSEDHAWAFDRFLEGRGIKDARRLDIFELSTHYEAFQKLTVIECDRCCEPFAGGEGETLCPGSCRECERCSNSDCAVSDRGDAGWLCDNCTPEWAS